MNATLGSTEAKLNGSNGSRFDWSKWITPVILILIQIVTIAVWKGTAAEKLEDHERRISLLEEANIKREGEAGAASEFHTTTVQQLAAIQAQLREIREAAKHQ